MSVSSRVSRTRLSVAVVLVVALVVICSLIWWNIHQVDVQKAADATPVPSLLTNTYSPAATAPAVTTSPSAIAKPSQRSNTPVTTPSPPATIVYSIIPYHLFIPAIGVNTTIASGPTVMKPDAFLGGKLVPSFTTPPDTAQGMMTTTWWSSGPKPGAPGTAVILGHTQIGGYGVFNHLGQLRAGQVVGVSGHGVTLKFEVILTRSGIKKTDATALRGTLEHPPAGARLALITCSGHFNGHESVENTVVFAKLVASSKS